MAKQIQSISLGAAGFMGVNSMDPPLQQDLAFAETANNAVIDKYGRLGGRKGFNTQTVSATPLGGENIREMHEWSVPGSSTLFAVTDDKVFRVDTVTDANDTLTEMTMPGGWTSQGTGFDMADFNGNLYFFQKGADALMVTTASNASDALVTVDSNSADAAPACPQGGIIMAAYGRLWCADIAGEEATVYWSDILEGDSWTEGGYGKINLTTVWPSGYDEVTGLAAHNDTLIFFGANSIVIYGNDDWGTPSGMGLIEAMSGVGCAYNASIVNTGEDVIYLSYTGVKSLARTVLTNSLPSGDLTANIRDKLIRSLRAETVGVSATFSQEETCYLITFQGQAVTYYIDFKEELEMQRRKCTVWPGSPFSAVHHSNDDGMTYVGGVHGVGTYSGYQDNGEGYTFTYFGPALDFGDASRVKIMKKMIATMIGGMGREATVYWGYGYAGAYKSEVLTIDAASIGEYGIDEYNTFAEFSVGQATTDAAVNTSGSGEVVRVGLAVEINGGEFSLQQLRIQVIMGRIV